MDTKILSILISIWVAVCVFMLVVIISQSMDSSNDSEVDAPYIVTVMDKFIKDGRYSVIDQTGRVWAVDCSQFEYNELGLNQTYLSQIGVKYNLFGDPYKLKYLTIYEKVTEGDIPCP